MKKLIGTCTKIAAAAILLLAAVSCKEKTRTAADADNTDNFFAGEFGEPVEEYSDASADFEYEPEPVKDEYLTVRGICLFQGSTKYVLKPKDANNPDAGTKLVWAGSYSEGEEINIIRDIDDTVPTEEFEKKKYYGVLGDDGVKYYIRDVLAAYDADPAVTKMDATTYTKPDIGYPAKTIIPSDTFISVKPSSDPSFYIVKAYSNSIYGVGSENVRYILKDKVITKSTELYGFNIIKRLGTETNDVIRQELIESFRDLEISDDYLLERLYDVAYNEK